MSIESPEDPNRSAADADPVAAGGPAGGGDPASEHLPDPGEPRLSRRAAWLAMGAVVLALVLVWAAPGIDDEAHYDDPADAAAVGRPAPLHFTLKDMNGVDVSLESFKGKVILINFWATWCPPCVHEIPWLVELQKTYQDDMVVLGVSIDDTADALKPYAAKMQMNYPVLVGVERQDMQDAYGPLFGIPVSFFIDREGTIARRHSGIASKEQMDEWIKALL
jgi:thiol-disulfide isomerase/thioredoxin